MKAILNHIEKKLTYQHLTMPAVGALVHNGVDLVVQIFKRQYGTYCDLYYAGEDVEKVLKEIFKNFSFNVVKNATVKREYGLNLATIIVKEEKVEDLLTKAGFKTKNAFKPNTDDCEEFFGNKRLERIFLLFTDTEKQ